ncbi:MAG: type IV pilus biogenesis/stability protein PilW [Gammaproteobacteria bacterium]|nr:MAG: type IV pilus biogenesis/stability protein PilW [Gammaproteobacteria bacterium]
MGVNLSPSCLVSRYVAIMAPSEYAFFEYRKDQHERNNMHRMNKVKVLIIRALSLLPVIVFAGCVTTTDAPYGKKEDSAKALTAYIQLGLAYIERDNMERARKHLKRALEIDPKSAGAHAALGLVYQNEGEDDLAEQEFLNSLRYDPSFTRGRTYYAAFLYSKGRYQEAYDSFQAASLDTGFASRSQIFTNMALCARKLNKRELMLKAYEKSLVLNSMQPNILLTLVKESIQDGQFGKAQGYYNRFIKLVGKSAGVTHSPRSLYLGIQLADHYQNLQLKSGYSDLLRVLYPDSQEYKQYRKSTSND